MAVIKSGGDIHALHEDCIAQALSLTTPKDACRLSLVDSIFRSAAQSDVVWERFLPSDYRDLISRSSDGPDSLLNRFESKKELYMYHCDHHILIDDGLKSFSLERSSGKKCYMLSARDLSIAWGDTSQYWQWTSHPGSRFSEVAELHVVWWLEIRGKISMNMLSLGTNYAAYLVFTCNQAIGSFEHHVVETYVGINDHEVQKRSVGLDPDGFKKQRNHVVPMHFRRLHPAHVQRSSVIRDNQFPKKRDDGWMEVELGELFVKGGEEGDLEMTLMEVKTGKAKSGLIIQGIEIRPKDC